MTDTIADGMYWVKDEAAFETPDSRVRVVDVWGGEVWEFHHDASMGGFPLEQYEILGPVASMDYVAGLEHALSEYVVLGAGKCTISKAHADMGRAALAAKP